MDTTLNFRRAVFGPRAAAALLGLGLVLISCAAEAPLEDRVRQRLEAKDYDGAMAILDQRLAREPGDDAAKVLRVRALLAAGRIDQAIQAYARLPEGVMAAQSPLARQIALALVEDALRMDDAYFQVRGALALATLGDRQAMATFREALAHPNSSVRATALRGLPRLQSPDTTGLAEDALRDPDAGVRAVAAETLGAMSAEAARPALREALKDNEGSVRLRAVVALALLGDLQTRAALRRAALPGEERRPEGREGWGAAGPADERLLVMNNPAERPYVQIVAAEALARVGDAQARAALVGMLDHPRRFLALFAAESLSNLGDSAPRAFLRTVVEDAADRERENRLYAAWTLARLGDGAGGPAVVALLSHPDEHVRQRAAWTLGQMGRLAPVQPLRKALRDPDRGVRYQAAWALAEVLLAGPPPPKPGES